MVLVLFTRWMWILLGKSSVLLLLEVSLQGRALPPIRYSHAGICPNDMNPNLWVDAQSTCKRECEADLVSDALPHVCALRAVGFVGAFGAAQPRSVAGSIAAAPRRTPFTQRTYLTDL